MEPARSKVTNVFSLKSKNLVGGADNSLPAGCELRPGGMLVQQRSSDSKNSSVSVPTILVNVKYGSLCHQLCVSSQASFGDLKKMLAERSGLHPQEQKLVFKNKERGSKEYLDVAKVKNGSKIELVEDVAGRERRCLEMIRNAKSEKASRSLAEISLEVDKLAAKVTFLETTASRAGKVTEKDVENLTEILMTKLIKLDEIVAEGDLKLKRKIQVRRVQKHIETLDMLKLQNAMPKNNTLPQNQKNPNGQIQQQKLKNLGGQVIVQQPLKHSDYPATTTTKWETFD